MEFDAFAFLPAPPVQEEAILKMDEEGGHHHIAQQTESGDAGEQSEQQTEPAKELGNDRKKTERGRNMQEAGHSGHGRRKARAAEPARHSLRAMREEDDTQPEPDHGRWNVGSGGQQFSEHQSNIHLDGMMNRAV